VDWHYGRWLHFGSSALLTFEYQQAVQLLLRVIPSVFTSEVFALKGGTAINLFLSPLVRLSVDLDVVFLPLGLGREEALRAIASELEAVEQRVAKQGLLTRVPGRASGEDTQLLVSDGQTTIKIEVNHVFRGSILEPHQARLDPSSQQAFAVDVGARLLAAPEVYAGKAVAALDRQHPRDLFDIWARSQGGAWTRDELDLVAVYVAAHSRPPHEIFAGRDKPLASLYSSALQGMVLGALPSVTELETARSVLRRSILRNLSPGARTFLTSFFRLSTEWDALPFPGLNRLPALQWKLRNLERFARYRRADFLRQGDVLEALMYAPVQDLPIQLGVRDQGSLP